MKKSTACLLIFSILLLLFFTPVSAFEKEQPGNTYIYNRDGADTVSPDAYILTKTIALSDMDGKKVSNPQDLFRANNGDIYISDTDHNKILILDQSFRLKSAIDRLKDDDGKTDSFAKPEGLFVDANGDILVADTGNQRIVRCNADGHIVQIIKKPDNMTGVNESDPFYPTKLAADKAGRLYIVARNINMGIIQLSKQGKFIGYIGAPKVQLILSEIFWRMLSTKEQKEKMQQFVPTEYSNITIDKESFLFGTISSIDVSDMKAIIAGKDTSGSVTPIKKLNTVGDDVLKRNGVYPPIGDLIFDESPSRIVDVALGSHGVYTLLDSTLGHIFTYDDNGNLLFAFGGIGANKSQLQRPVSAVYAGDTLLVLDNLLGKLFVYEPTEYGNQVLKAVSAQYDGNFEASYVAWSEVAENNLNFEYAFVGLGNARMQEKKYAEAMACFKYADDKINFSKAKGMLRKEQMKTWFPVIFVSLLVLVIIWAAVSMIRKIVRYCRGEYSDDFFSMQ